MQDYSPRADRNRVGNAGVRTGSCIDYSGRQARRRAGSNFRRDGRPFSPSFLADQILDAEIALKLLTSEVAKGIFKGRISARLKFETNRSSGGAIC
jgi:hypothetical protein